MVDNVSFEANIALHNLGDTINASNWLDATCDKGKGYFITGECENGHRFAKELICNKEWCQVCGADGSIAHNRKIARWLGKAQRMKSVGYFVFTLPPEIRDRYRKRVKRIVIRDGEKIEVLEHPLAKLGHDIQGLMKAQGYDRGLRRWHFFGEKNTRFHPHLNVLVDAGYIPPDELDTIKKAYSVLLGVEMADIHYHYRQKPGEKYHTLKYVTKASFLDYNWDIELASEIRGFRNMVSWGRGQWNNPPVWSLDDLKGDKMVEDLSNYDLVALDCLQRDKPVCPECGKPLKWGEALPVKLLDLVEKKDLGCGYYRLTDAAPREKPPPVKDRFLSEFNLASRQRVERHRKFADNFYNESLADAAFEDMMRELQDRR